MSDSHLEDLTRFYSILDGLTRGLGGVRRLYECVTDFLAGTLSGTPSR